MQTANASRDIKFYSDKPKEFASFYSLPEDIKLCPGHLNHDYIFDGMCDADLNIKECDFDGGDCCLENVDCEYCAAESCLCDETGLLHCNGKIKE